MQQEATAGSSESLDERFRRIAGLVGATEAATFCVCRHGTPDEHLHLMTHVRGGAPVDAATREAAVSAFEKILRPCVTSAGDAAVDVEGNDKLVCLVRVTPRGDHAVAMAFIVRRADRDVAESRLRAFMQRE